MKNFLLLKKDSEMTILGLDISAKSSGWCVIDPVGPKILSQGKYVLPKYYDGLTKNELLMQSALMLFWKRVYSLVKLYKPDHVCAEDINIRHITTMRTLSQFHAAAVLAIGLYNSKNKNNLILNKVHNASIRSQFGFTVSPGVGTGKSRKDAQYMAMIDRINRGDKKEKTFTFETLKEISKLAKIDFSKIMMILTIKKMFDIDYDWEDHDIADAFAVAYTHYKRNLR